MTQTAGRLQDRIAIVTGASRGLGRFFAEVLAREGAKVALMARAEPALSQLAQAITQAGGIAHPVPMDVSIPESVVAAFAIVIERWGVPTVIINNAGITETIESLRQSTEGFTNILNVDLRGPFLVAREAATHMVAQSARGSIVNVASILGLRQAGQVTAYATAKAGLIQMTKQLALEWARHAIRVNALAPGYVATDFNRDFFATEQGAALIRRIPMRRLATLHDLAEPLMLLAGDGGGFMTGVVLPVDGGHLLSSL
jgi:NAD(P)-dependent dehydrogenase (short-subunit alcohol dehydrogenase family)